MKKTIKISEKNYDALTSLKGEKTYDEIITELIGGGYDEKAPEIRRERVAFHLENIAYDNQGKFLKNSDCVVTFKQLAKSKVGDEFSPTFDDYKNRQTESVKVIYKDNDLVLVKYNQKDTVTGMDENTVIAVHIL